MLGRMTIAMIPLIAAIAGLLMFAVADNGKVQSVGLALFTAGMTAFLLLAGGKAWLLN